MNKRVFFLVFLTLILSSAANATIINETRFPTIVASYDNEMSLVSYSLLKKDQGLAPYSIKNLKNLTPYTNPQDINNNYSYYFIPTNPLRDGTYEFSITSENYLGALVPKTATFTVAVPFTDIFLINPETGVSNTNTFDLKINTIDKLASCGFSQNEQKTYSWASQSPDRLFTSSDGEIFTKTGYTIISEDEAKTIYILCKDLLDITNDANPKRFTLMVDKSAPIIKSYSNPKKVIDTLNVTLVAESQIFSNNPDNTINSVHRDDVKCKFSTDQNKEYDSMEYFFYQDPKYYNKNNTITLTDSTTPRINTPENYTFYVQCKNKAGFISQKTNINFLVNLSEGARILNSGPKGIINGNNINLYAETNRLSICKFRKGTDTFTNFEDTQKTKHEKTLTLIDGTYLYEIICQQFDYGNDQSAEVSFIVDKTPPSQVAINIKPACNQTNIDINLSSSDNIELTNIEYKITNGSTTIVALKNISSLLNGVYFNEPNLNLVIGKTYTLTATAYDTANNKAATSTSDFLVRTISDDACKERTPPTVIVSSYNTNVNEVTIDIRCQDVSGCQLINYKYILETDTNQNCPALAGITDTYTTPIKKNYAGKICYKATDGVGNIQSGNQTISLTRIVADEDEDGYCRADYTIINATIQCNKEIGAKGTDCVDDTTNDATNCAGSFTCDNTHSKCAKCINPGATESSSNGNYLTCFDDVDNNCKDGADCLDTNCKNYIGALPYSCKCTTGNFIPNSCNTDTGVCTKGDKKCINSIWDPTCFAPLTPKYTLLENGIKYNNSFILDGKINESCFDRDCKDANGNSIGCDENCNGKINCKDDYCINKYPDQCSCTSGAIDLNCGSTPAVGVCKPGHAVCSVSLGNNLFTWAECVDTSGKPVIKAGDRTEICNNNNIDDDCDGISDCADSDCFSSSVCACSPPGNQANCIQSEVGNCGVVKKTCTFNFGGTTTWGACVGVTKTGAYWNDSTLEICGNRIDDNCDGNTDDTTCITITQPPVVTPFLKLDKDSDGYCKLGEIITNKSSECSKEKGTKGTDCNDDNPSINIGAIEICGNSIDENCDDSLTNGCAVSICGNGKRELNEQCDANDFAPISTLCNAYSSEYSSGSLTCNSDCTYNSDLCVSKPGICGDSKLNRGELCDGNAFGIINSCLKYSEYIGGQIDCTNNCKLDLSGCINVPTCNNGKIDAGEQCDGNKFGKISKCSDYKEFNSGVLKCDALTCQMDTSLCVPVNKCGNGKIDVGETCDGVNFGSLDNTCIGYENNFFTGGTLACDPITCKIRTDNCYGVKGVCNDGVLNTGETCDNSLLGKAKLCKDLGFESGELSCKNCNIDTTACAPKPPCSNGFIDAGETCDTTNFDSSSNNCKDYTSYFLSGLMICTSKCQIDTSNCIASQTCGNRIIDSGEQCDESNLGSIPQQCSQFSSSFKSGTLKCNGCILDTSNCTQINTCGNGKIDIGETCDGTNFGTLSNTCTNYSTNYESGTLKCVGCMIDSSSCINKQSGFCGDKTINTFETCDGTTFSSSLSKCNDYLEFISGSLNCEICQVDTSKCVPKPKCGNGIIDSGEACDWNGNIFGAIDSCSKIGKFTGGTLDCDTFCNLDVGQCYSKNESAISLHDKDLDGYCEKGYNIINRASECPKETGTIGTDCVDDTHNKNLSGYFIHPEAIDICNGIDDNCDGPIDENCKCTKDSDCVSNQFCILPKCNLITNTCDYTTLKDASDSRTCTIDSCDEVQDIFIHDTDNCLCGNNNDCNDNNPCSTNICDVGKCRSTNNFEICSDNNFCTSNDICKNKQCTPGGALSCDDGRSCSQETCVPEIGCMYIKNNCNCTVNTECTDGNSCTSESCISGKCDFPRILNAGVSCDNWLFCDGAKDACNANGQCVGGVSTTGISDAINCTTNFTSCAINPTCSEQNNQCTANMKSCTCKVDADCDDGNTCTDDTCLGGACISTENTLFCDDGNNCTDNDVCISGSCIGNQISSCTLINNDVTDSDNDGLPDWWEIKYFRKAICDDVTVCGPEADPDNDGLNNLKEFEANTDPTKIDTDGDGLSDGDEVNEVYSYKLNPLEKDTDDDGYDDKTEIDAKTDPTNPESYPGKESNDIDELVIKNNNQNLNPNLPIIPEKNNLISIILLIIGGLSIISGASYLLYKKYYINAKKEQIIMPVNTQNKIVNPIQNPLTQRIYLKNKTNTMPLQAMKAAQERLALQQSILNKRKLEKSQERNKVLSIFGEDKNVKDGKNIETSSQSIEELRLKILNSKKLVEKTTIPNDSKEKNTLGKLSEEKADKLVDNKKILMQTKEKQSSDIMKDVTKESNKNKTIDKKEEISHESKDKLDSILEHESTFSKLDKVGNHNLQNTPEHIKEKLNELTHEKIQEKQDEDKLSKIISKRKIEKKDIEKLVKNVKKEEKNDDIFDRLPIKKVKKDEKKK